MQKIENLNIDENNKENIENVSTSSLAIKKEIKSESVEALKERLLNGTSSSTIIKKESEVKDLNIKENKYPASLDKDEPLCIESKNRFVLFPIANQEVLTNTYIYTFKY